MKPEMITVKTPDGFTLKMPAQILATTVIAATLAHVDAAQPMRPAIPEPASALVVPAIGEYWPGQGGYNGGFVPARDGIPAHYLIVGAKDVGKHQWGGYQKESGATSKLDGQANTKAMLADGGHPAAIAASEHTADGHTDFYLPAAAELYHCWLFLPDLFDKGCWYWSSSQRSAIYAFGMDFVVGLQYYLGKDLELRVRPVRRLFI